MTAREVSIAELRRLLVDQELTSRWSLVDGIALLLVRDSDEGPPLALPPELPFVVAVVDPAVQELAGFADVLLARDEVPDVLATVASSPLASVQFALLLRAFRPDEEVVAALVRESTVYSLLQGGGEFARWRQSRPARTVTDSAPRVDIQRQGDRLVVTLTRPERRNAFDRQLRDELVAALVMASLAEELFVELRGSGPDFCAGGDLDEFGSRSDIVLAQLVRLIQSPGRLLHELGPRSEVYLHGNCIGSGIEIPAFSPHVIAHPHTRIALPELKFGLIPGAGGTVSLPRRIGRQRMAWLALTGRTIDAGTAHAWGLVDDIQSVVVAGG